MAAHPRCGTARSKTTSRRRGGWEAGGAIANINGASPSIDRCIFRSNTAGAVGGAIVNIYGSSPVIRDCIFDGNSATWGGAVASWVDSPSHFERCLFVGNSSSDLGGAVSIGTLDHYFVSCAFVHNVASSGGAVYVNAGKALFAGCTFSGNEALGLLQGGAIFSSNDSVVSVASTIFWQDYPTELDQREGGSFFIMRCVLPAEYEGDGNMDVDPMLADASSGDLHLLPGSPCIDAAWWLGPVPLDLDGMPRVDDPAVPDTGGGPSTWIDIGALEYVP